MTSVVADSHAILWYVQGSDRLSEEAASALASAEAGGEVVVSVATLVDLWYVTQTTERVTADDLVRLRDVLSESASVDLHPIDVAVADAATSIPRELLTDPWDRFIVATANALEVPLVTRDRAIAKAVLVETIWSPPRSGRDSKRYSADGAGPSPVRTVEVRIRVPGGGDRWPRHPMRAAGLPRSSPSSVSGTPCSNSSARRASPRRSRSRRRSSGSACPWRKRRGVVHLRDAWADVRSENNSFHQALGHAANFGR